MSKQQKQTKIFFEKEAVNWSIRADQNSNKIPNTIIQRNSFVFDMIKKYKKKNILILDVDLVIYVMPLQKL